MKVVSFTGKSGTGKSFQATALAQRRGFDAIIDDGLLIYKGQIVAGSSAKKCASKAAAMRTALFNYEDHREAVKAAIERCDPQALMIIGTSDRMTDLVAEQLGLPHPEERIYIEDVTTEEERKIAAHYRIDEGEHVIPAPSGQLRRDFAGYFMDPIKQFIHRLESLENDQYMMKDVFTVPEACKFLELSQSQLYKLTSKLKIPHYKPRGKIVYFDKKELLEWVKRNHQQEIQYADEPEEET